MVTKHITFTLAALLFVGMTLSAVAERDRLYTNPDPSCSGGIKGHISKPTKPIVQILAMPPDEPRFVYKGRIVGSDRQGFLFENLPVRKYSLFLIYEDGFYEGLGLHRGGSTLTSEDEKQINKTVQKSEPFFTVKIIHRLEGETGNGNFAKCVCTFLRDASSRGGSGHRRTFKLVVLKDVGPGWQFVRARDLYPVFVDPSRGRIKHNYRKSLGRIRVTDSIKDIGEIDLKKVGR